MLRSLYSGISGMKVNQTKLDVIGNNVANVGTTAFKSSRVRFQDMVSQNLSSAMAPSYSQGGVNPSQVGLGVKVAGVDAIMKQGMMQPTGRNLDVALDGEGYFMVGRGPAYFSDDKTIKIANNTISDNPGDMAILYSRDGSLTLDSDGNLLTSDGYRVMGYSVSTDGESAQESINAEDTAELNAGDIMFVNGNGALLDKDNNVVVGNSGAEIRNQITVSTADSKKKVKLIVDGVYKEVDLGKCASGKDVADTINKAFGKIASIEVDGTNASLVLKSKKSIMVVGDGDGDGSYGLPKDKISIGGLKVDGTSSDYNSALYEIDDIDTDIDNKKEFAMVDDEGKIIAVKTSGGDLQLVSPEGELYNAAGAASGKYININEVKSKIQHADLKVKTQNLKPLRIPNTIVEKIPSYDTKVAADGTVTINPSFKYKKTRVTSFSIEKNGVIKGVLEDGRVAALGQIATSSFKNPAGLTKMGKNLYQVSSNAGEAVVRTGIGADPDKDNSAGYGDMLQGMLEMSNVDLAEQFTDMIVTSRAFQASSKMITTGDEILQDIINLKR